MKSTAREVDKILYVHSPQCNASHTRSSHQLLDLNVLKATNRIPDTQQVLSAIFVLSSSLKDSTAVELRASLNFNN